MQGQINTRMELHMSKMKQKVLKQKYILISLYILFFTNLHAVSLNNVYKVNEFKIFYTLKGKDKLPSNKQVDNNYNGTPDYIENIGYQLTTASKLFTSLGYIHPLKSKRYTHKAYFIQVSVKSIKNNGSAYDGINKARKNNIEKNQASLSITVSNNLSDHSLTPLHEYFHLIQNGYTMFKNRWYTEGTARWSETLFRKGIGEQKKLPSSIQQLETILSQTYNTKFMWNRLAYLLDTNNCHLDTNLITSKYVDNKTTIIDDKLFCGNEFMKSFLENLMKNDKLASKDMNYKTYEWKESNQKSPINNKYILSALRDTIYSFNDGSNQEINAFIRLLNKYIR
jgi:hypothetical protein